MVRLYGFIHLLSVRIHKLGRTFSSADTTNEPVSRIFWKIHDPLLDSVNNVFGPAMFQPAKETLPAIPSLRELFIISLLIAPLYTLSNEIRLPIFENQ